MHGRVGICFPDSQPALAHRLRDRLRTASVPSELFAVSRLAAQLGDSPETPWPAGVTALVVIVAGDSPAREDCTTALYAAHVRHVPVAALPVDGAVLSTNEARMARRRFTLEGSDVESALAPIVAELGRPTWVIHTRTADAHAHGTPARPPMDLRNWFDPMSGPTSGPPASYEQSWGSPAKASRRRASPRWSLARMAGGLLGLWPERSRASRGSGSETLAVPRQPGAPAARAEVAVPPQTGAAPVRAPQPAPTMDLVRFSVTAPPSVPPGGDILFDVWAHLESHRDEVLRRAREAALGKELVVRERGPVRIMRGTAIQVLLDPIEGLRMDEREEALAWEGEIASVCFVAQVDLAARPGPRTGTLRFLVDGLLVSRLSFQFAVGPAAAAARLDTAEQRVRSAFACYASEDRDEVLRIVQGVQKVAPSLDVFLDVARLRSGQLWEAELWKVIPTRDVFYLFWSRAARRSPWVEKEWRCALKSRGLDFIDPAPLDPPEIAPPPEELAGLHFGDWTLAYRRRTRPPATDA